MASRKRNAAAPASVESASSPVDLNRAPSRTQVAMAEFIKNTTGYDVDVQSVRLTLLLTKAFRNSESEVARRAERRNERENHAELVEKRRQERNEARARKLEEKAAAIRDGKSRGPGRPKADAPAASAPVAADDDEF